MSIATTTANNNDNDDTNDNDNNNTATTIGYWEGMEDKEREKRWRGGYRELSYICLCNSHIVCL